ncbi:MAG: hypothetical protein JO205_14110 [Pseudolabrys sp.]|nr:hypothetical protein [Pseudolabrys sp.]
MKVIFFDVDGVLNCAKTANPCDRTYILDRTLVVRLQQLVRKTGAKLVMSSSWRHEPNAMRVFNRSGIVLFDRIGKGSKRERRRGILRWVKRHPQVERFAILDDEDQYFEGLPLFQASPRTGLTADLARDLANYLNGRSPFTPDNVITS